MKTSDIKKNPTWRAMHALDTRAIFVGGAFSDDLDLCLAELAAGVGFISAAVSHNSQLKPHMEAQRISLKPNLEKVGGHALGWLMAIGVKDAYKRIAAERDRQNELLRGGQIFFNCASGVVDDKRKMRVLVEELGEVAKEVDRMEEVWSNKANPLSRDAIVSKDLIIELVQVAAVSVAWLEALEVKP